MEEFVKLLIDNGISVFCVAAFIYYIFTDKKQSNEIMEKMSDTLTAIQVSLQQLNDRISILENKKTKKVKDEK